MKNFLKFRLPAVFLLILTLFAVSAIAADSTIDSNGAENDKAFPSGGLSDSAEGTEKKIRIGTYYTDQDYADGKDSENLRAYLLEYLRQISKYTKWSCQLVSVSPEESLALLENGEIDFIAPIPYSSEKTQYLDYAEDEAGFSYGVLAVKSDNTKYVYGDFQNFDGITVGAVTGTSLDQKFTAYCENNDIKARIKLFDNEKELHQELSEGSVDAILTNSFENLSAYRVIAKFSPEKFYFATAKGNGQLLSKLNDASRQIKMESPDFEAKLLEKYSNTDSGNTVVFTKEEKGFIDAGNIIRAAYVDNRIPVSYKDEKGNFSGIIADLTRMIEVDSGLKFGFIGAQTLKDCVNLVQKGKADIILGIDNDEEWIGYNNLKVTSPLIISPIFMIANPRRKTDSSQIRRIGMTDASITARKAANTYYHADTVVYRTMQQCFDALLSGEIDLTAGDSYMLHYMLENQKYMGFSVFAVPDTEQQIAIGIADTYDERLLSILNKSILKIPAADINSVTVKNMVSPGRLSFSRLISENIGGFILAILTVLVLFASMLLYALSIKNKLRIEKQKLLYFDDITGIWNYNKFKIEASELLKHAKNKYTFINLSVERLRFINEMHGYSVGDEILRQMATCLKKCCDFDELYSRIYAGHFAALLKFEGKDEFAARFNKLVGEFSSSVGELCDSRITVIAGIYIIKANENDVNEMFAKANHAREAIKESYKSTFMFYNKKMFLEVQTLIDVDRNMVKALRNHEFIPFLQPKYHLTEKKVVGAEVLVRWLPPDKEIIYPSEFISYFERTGFIVDLDYYLFEEVCKTVKRWMCEKKKIFPVSCNFSILHTYEPDFADRLLDIAAEYDVPPEYLEIEFTESVASENQDDVVDHIDRLRSYGFKISLDDFGSGYSSLSLLSKLKVDFLKLDKAFIGETVMHSEKSNILSAIVDMAKKLNVEIVCEGVETEEQVGFLKKLGCNIIQGFYYSRALPVSEFEQLVSTQSTDIPVTCENIG